MMNTEVPLGVKKLIRDNPPVQDAVRELLTYGIVQVTSSLMDQMAPLTSSLICYVREPDQNQIVLHRTIHREVKEYLSNLVIYSQANADTARSLDESLGQMVRLNGEDGL